MIEIINPKKVIGNWPLFFLFPIKKSNKIGWITKEESTTEKIPTTATKPIDFRAGWVAKTRTPIPHKVVIQANKTEDL